MRAFKSVGAALAVFALLGTRDAKGQKVSPDHSPIKLTVTISSVRYCESDSEVYTAQYSFIAEYRNVSDKPLTLVVGSEVPNKLVAAADERDLAAGVLQLRMDLESYPTDAWTNAILGENVHAEKTVVVRSGQSVHSKIQISLPVRNVSKNIPGTVEAGKHVLVVEVALRAKAPSRGPEGFRWVSVRSQPV
jgi:hypothetical protein